LSQGNPLKALETVLDVVRKSQGEEGVFKVLTDARDRHAAQRNAMQTTTTPDSTLQETPQNTEEPNEHKALLEEAGKIQYLREALSDGSSKLCPKCNGVILSSRMEAHLSDWCPALDYT